MSPERVGEGASSEPRTFRVWLCDGCVQVMTRTVGSREANCAGPCDAPHDLRPMRAAEVRVVEQQSSTEREQERAESAAVVAYEKVIEDGGSAELAEDMAAAARSKILHSKSPVPESPEHQPDERMAGPGPGDNPGTPEEAEAFRAGLEAGKASAVAAVVDWLRAQPSVVGEGLGEGLNYDSGKGWANKIESR